MIYSNLSRPQSLFFVNLWSFEMTLSREMTLCETVEIWTLTCKGGGWFPIETPIAAALFWADWSSLAGGVWNKEVT